MYGGLELVRALSRPVRLSIFVVILVAGALGSCGGPDAPTELLELRRAELTWAAPLDTTVERSRLFVGRANDGSGDWILAFPGPDGRYDGSLAEGDDGENVLRRAAEAYRLYVGRFHLERVEAQQWDEIGPESAIDCWHREMRAYSTMQRDLDARLEFRKLSGHRVIGRFWRGAERIAGRGRYIWSAALSPDQRHIVLMSGDGDLAPRNYSFDLWAHSWSGSDGQHYHQILHVDEDFRVSRAARLSLRTLKRSYDQCWIGFEGDYPYFAYWDGRYSIEIVEHGPLLGRFAE